MKFEVEGLQETIAMLKNAPKTIVASGFTRALSAAGSIVAAEMEANTPTKKADTGGLLDLGELREAITVAVELDSNFRGGRVNVGFGRLGNVASWLEYGHRMVTHRGKLIGEVKAHPFMRRSLDMSADAAVDAFTDSLRETIVANFPQQ